jgi:enoyl-CoA hydratase/carnithine racemase
MVGGVAEVAIRRDGPVLWITLDRPEALNALNAPMAAGLAVAL